MEEEEASPQLLRREADSLLHDQGLLNLLGKYGQPHAVGSYALDLMVWRDLDLYLVAPAISVSEFFALGQDIAIALSPHRMNFRNERLWKTPNLPKEGLYWGIYFGLDAEWKMDVWAISQDEFDRLETYPHGVESKLDFDSRQTILKLKLSFFEHPEYRRSFSAKDIYDAVLDEGIRDENGFRQLLALRGISL